LIQALLGAAMEGSTMALSQRDPKPDQYLTRWLVCGPFLGLRPGQENAGAHAGHAAFDHDYLTEHGGESGIQPTPGLTHRHSGGEYQWREVSSDQKGVDLGQIYGEENDAVAYAWTVIEMSAPAAVQLGIGSDDAVKVWLNGELVHENWVFRPLTLDQDLVPIRFRKGKNHLLLKIYNGDGSWGFACRLAGPEAEARALLLAVSADWWTNDPAPTRALLERLEQDLAAGPETFVRTWARGVIRTYSLARIDNPLPPALRHRLGSVADRISAFAGALPPAAQVDLYYLCARFYYAAGQTANALAAGTEALRLPVEPESVVALRARSLLADHQYRASGRQGTPPVDEYLTMVMAKDHVPGLAVGVVRDGKVLLAKGYGLADVEGAFPATEDTVFQICSITKTFTAVGLMMLGEEGRITLEDSIRKWLPQLPSVLDSVTLRHLLSHTSGIKDIWATIVEQVKTPNDLRLVRSDLTLESEPGERYAYNNTGFHLLGLVFQSVTGRTHAQFIDERIFQPLGMSVTPSREPEFPPERRARGYTWEAEALRAVSEGRGYWISGAGGFASSVSDLIQWVRGALDTESLLKKESLEEMWTPATLNDGTTVGTGIGWGTSTLLGRRKVGHLGGDRGFRSSFMRYLNDRLTIILLANSDTVDQSLVEEGIASYFLPPPAVREDRDPETTARLRGVLLRLSGGRPDPEAFTPETFAALSSELTQVSAFYRSLGPLTALDFIEQQTEGRVRKHRYRASFKQSVWIQTFILNEDGRIGELLIDRRGV
jgi:D-alanyl-D-alanine carboxypeptidase